MPKESIYPWDLWFDGNKRELLYGEHFNISVQNFRSICYTAGERKGKSVNVIFNKNKNGVILQAKDKNLKNSILLKRVESSQILEPELELESELEQEIVNSFNELTLLEYSECKDDYVIDELNKLVKKYSFEVMKKANDYLIEMFHSGQKEVDEVLYDGYGNIVPKIKTLEDGFQVQIGYETKKVIRTFKPSHKLELKYPQDINISGIKMGEAICRLAQIGGIETKDWEVISKKSELKIYVGELAEQRRINRNSNLLNQYRKKDAIPITYEKAAEWMQILRKDGQLLLWKGRHYIVSSNDIVGLLHSWFPNDDFAGKEEIDKSGWTTLLLTIRQPQLATFDPKWSAEKVREIREETGIGLKFDYDEIENTDDSHLLLNQDAAKRKYLEELTELQKRLAHAKKDAPEEIKEEVIKELENDIDYINSEYGGLLSVEDCKLIEDKVYSAGETKLIEEKKQENEEKNKLIKKIEELKKHLIFIENNAPKNLKESLTSETEEDIEQLQQQLEEIEE